MLANQLNVLLAQRQLSIKQVVADLGISRSSISNIVNNPSANITTETIDRLCNYLGVMPTDFFIYAPYEIEYGFNGNDEITMSITHNKKNYLICLSITVFDRSGIEDMGISRGISEDTDLYVLIEDAGSEDFTLAYFYDQLPLYFKQQVTNSLITWGKAVLEPNLDTWYVHGSGDNFTMFSILNQIHDNKDTASLSFSLPWSDTLKRIDLTSNTFIE